MQSKKRYLVKEVHPWQLEAACNTEGYRVKQVLSSISISNSASLTVILEDDQLDSI